MRALTTELIRHGRIKTTLVKARRCARRPTTVTLAKDGSLHARRQALSYLYDKQLVHALFEQAPERTPSAMAATRASSRTASAAATTRRWASSSSCKQQEV